MIEEPKSDKERRTLTGKHVLLALVAFFGVIFAVNGFMAYQAVRGFPGLTVEKPYALGRDYNARLARAEAARAAGWRAEITLARDSLHLVVSSPQEQASATTHITITLSRPATAEGEISLMMPVLSSGGGEYSVRGLELTAGRWLSRLEVWAERTQLYRQDDILWIEPEAVE